jgi:hypothetical protein
MSASLSCSLAVSQILMSMTGRSTPTTAATLKVILWYKTSGRLVTEQKNYLSTLTMLTRIFTGYSQLGRRTKVASASIRHRYLAYPRQRFQGLARFRRSSSLHHRKVRRGVTAAKVAHMLQPSRPTALQELRRTHAEAHVGCRRDGRFRPGVDVLTWSESMVRYRARYLSVVVVTAVVEKLRHSFACTYARISDDRMRKRGKTNRIGNGINNRETPQTCISQFFHLLWFPHVHLHLRSRMMALS